MDNIIIAVDTMGSDNGSEYFIQGISEAMTEYDDLEFLVTGKEEELKQYIEQYGSGCPTVVRCRERTSSRHAVGYGSENSFRPH